MYESPVLPIRMKVPWKNQYSFYQSFCSYSLIGASKSRSNRRNKGRNLAFICLMFFVSFFLVCYHYQNIPLNSSSRVTDDLVDVSSSSVINTAATKDLSASARSPAPSFSLSSLLWPRQMFSSTLQVSSGEDKDTPRQPTKDEETREEHKKQSDEEEAETEEKEEREVNEENEEKQQNEEREQNEEEQVASARGVKTQAEVAKEQTVSVPESAPSASPLASEKRLPQVIIIGVRKCGTRALLEFLNLHSRIQKARDEVHFFDEDVKYQLGLQWYKSQMPYSYDNQVTIEKTPAYFVTDSAPERIRAMNSSIRLILLVRDPVTRLISDYAQLNANKLAKKERPLRSIEQMVLLEDGSVNVNYRPVKTSIYSYYYSKWAETFPSSQIHVVDGDRLIDDPHSELLKVIQFLNLDVREITKNQFSFNATKGFFCIKVSPSDVDKCLNETKGRRHPSVREDVVRTLRKFYAPYNRHFYSLVGRHFNWREE